MDKINYQTDYDSSLSTLEDIQLLSEFSMSPLIGRAYYHLSEMKRKADLAGTEQTAQYFKITKVLDEKLESIFTDFFSNKSKYKGFEYHKSVSRIDLKKWNLLLEIIPEVLSVVSLFNYYGLVEARIDENNLLFEGLILEDAHIQMNRKFIYIITRKLLREKVLLTFNLTKTGRAGHLKLKLKVDISHDDSLVYKVNFKASQKENYLVGFSNIFCHYRTHQSRAKEAGEHHIIELASDMSLKHYYGILDLNPLESANKEILHFPFLFRPVSIILPMKGNLSKDSFSRNLVSNHDDENKREQNVSTYYRTIDFFSLFNI